VRASVLSILAILTGIGMLGTSAPNPAPAGAPVVTPAIHIIEMPGPFSFARCDVRLLPGNQVAGTVAYENHDLALRPAIRMDGDVDPINAAGAPIVNFSITVRGMLRAAGSSGAPANAGANTFAQAAPAANDLHAATAIDCLPRRVLFANGDIWMRFDQPHTGGTSEPARCQSLFAAGEFQLAEYSCMELAKRAHRSALYAKPGTPTRPFLEENVRDTILAARASSRRNASGYDGIGDTSLLLESLDIATASNDLDDLARLVPGLCRQMMDQFDACIRKAQAAARATYASATPDERRVFLIRGKDASDYRGMPCTTDASQKPSQDLTVWLYCDRLQRRVAEYDFVKGKLVKVDDPQNASKPVRG
jgi:hypothetical protein